MGAIKEVLVPDIGDFKDVDVIEVLVKPGDRVEKESSLVSLESDKATMEIPSPSAGTVRELRVKVGDKVSEGSLILMLEEAGEGAAAAPPAAAKPLAASPPEAAVAPPPATAPVAAPTLAQHTAPVPFEPTAEATAFKPHASPSVRKFARELGVDLARLKGTGPKDRIVLEDVQAFVKGVMRDAPAQTQNAAPAGGLALAAWPQVDFAKFGPIETRPLS
jgi:pyruvate dehydrogenase E2 component (dihydrolipoamide acetyltransferase)